ncbi:class I SAM-dependent methyltransferase [Prosthecobacter sp.]|uniref:class I SAM-dependent methyltransferase n=1 Tax=Prosthecobacter sp. TaxID=1965333 RepID=UPI001D50230B|nr:class I SAM-dependent methyltransferase [Prosthecobacter sp.]MCB1278112.1 class I SAM-dependent methyltransferase [Prosthecobacter sp.]
MSAAPKCPACDASAVAEVGRAGVCDLWRCSCGFVFADRATWRDPYSNRDYYDPANQPAEEYPLRITTTERDRIASVRRFVQSGRLLDFGGGIGKTALAGHAAGFSAIVLEDSHKAVSDGKAHHPEIEWLEGKTIPDSIEDSSLDVITLFHVLEHLPDPRAALSQLHRKLRPGGLLVVEVPNWGSHMRWLHGLRWQFVLDHHLNHFTAASLTSLVEKAGFSRCAVEFRRTFAINEAQMWKEPLKKLLCFLGFGDILRCAFRKSAA